MRTSVGSSAAALIGGVLLAVALSACSSQKKDTYVEKPVDELYNSAMDLLAQEDYSKAADGFDEVEQQHPYSVWATRAQLMSAYALYQASKYDDSIVAADRYIQLHPGNRDVAYAYYLKALDYYVQIEDVGR
ncbi:MAG: outer membrane protein assembly factor BamD, partial [Stellaceae bacterium]